MLGWTILFALMALPGVAATVGGYPAAISLKTASVVFSLLFFVSVLTQMVRSKAH
ncbi:MAG TPA: hypothetical protein VGN17_10460 [Bryobacteraceae bacterium]|jgi:hypothetical protein